MCKKYISVVLLFILINSVFADINVKSFRKLENDMSARIDAPITDQNGDQCAIIKVVTTEKGFTFDGGQLGIVKTVEKPAEIWVYVPYGLKRLTISHPFLGILRDYLIPQSIDKATVYELVLISGRVITTVEEEIASQWLLIHTDPPKSIIYLNDQYVKTGEYQAKLKPGVYTYRVEAPLYHPEAGKLEITDSKKELTVTLKPAFGFLNVTTTPENAARVIIDGKEQAQLTPSKSEALASGEHTVQILKEMYQPDVRKVTILDGQLIPLNVTLKPNFAELFVTAPANATLYINNQQKGTGNWQGRVAAGVYSIEARMDKYRPANKDVELTAGDKTTIDLQPTPIFGSLDVMTSPSGASITINGKDYGTTPNTINKLPIGDYTVQLSKSGYTSIERTVTITDGRTSELMENFSEGRTVTINSDPTGANLFIDGNSCGKTPYSGFISYGSHTMRLELGENKVTKKLIISESDSPEYTLNFNPAFGFVDITTTENSSIYIDGEMKGKSSWQGKLQTGTYNLEVKQDGYRSAVRQIEINENDNLKIAMEPIQTFGSIDIRSIPVGAKVLINGVEKGVTPLSVSQVLTGTCNVDLLMPNYMSVQKKVTITENETAYVSETLQSGISYNFTTLPTGAELYVDGSFVGKTPVSTSLTNGQHAIKFTDGKGTREEQLNVDKDTPLNLYYELYDCYMNKQITSIPAGATVTSDGTELGITPLSVLLQNKEQKITLNKTGYSPYNLTLKCTDEKEDINARLKSKRRTHFMLDAGLALPLINSATGEFPVNTAYSFRLGIVKTIGVYVKYTTNNNSEVADYTVSDLPTTYYYKNSGSEDSQTEYYSRTGYVAGFLLHVNPITINIGGGVGTYNHYVRKDLYDYATNSNLGTFNIGDDYSITGFEGDAGLTINLGVFTISANVSGISSLESSTLDFKYKEFTLGIGFLF